MWINITWHNAVSMLVIGVPSTDEAERVLRPQMAGEFPRILEFEYIADVKAFKGASSYAAFERDDAMDWTDFVAELAAARPGRGIGFRG